MRIWRGFWNVKGSGAGALGCLGKWLLTLRGHGESTGPLPSLAWLFLASAE